MGNTQTPDGTDYDYYRRPADGIEPEWQRQPSVQIVDDGAGTGAVPGSAGAAGDGREPMEPRPTGPAGVPPDSLPFWQRFNLALAAAWVLVGLLLAAGLAWFTGVLPPSQMIFDPSGNNLNPPSSVIVMNLQSMGSLPFLFGLMGAFTLLTVQAAGFRRKARS
ncbi:MULTISPECIES: hypothetical protein [unclassified Arthrobacter]|uniref:hypothetical protein n=1 Tax=unclassified Arthrobacter TaxID=235627 RepID=UPI0006DB15F1|nr:MULTISPECIES: hypothetical protein [unclassified Arthrobacter]KPN19377.1 hypothetical protein AO716_06225 [Arthrobacter sp. Edens01]MSR98510.1 hypothetical protein [Arthrobacter sp. BL-252-APC-1A]